MYPQLEPNARDRETRVMNDPLKITWQQVAFYCAIKSWRTSVTLHN